MKYAMQKRAKKACECGGAGCEMCHGGAMAKGGEATHDAGEEGIVDRIMKRFAKGGEVEGEPVADFESNDFDYMDQIPPIDEADYTGKNSGDEKGDKEVDDEEKDVVSRVMKSRKKGDRMPRPA